jgi:hypothetical protein
MTTMTIEDLWAKHDTLLQLSYNVHPETGAHTLHAWVTAPDAAATHDLADPTTWLSVSYDSTEVPDAAMKADLAAFWVDANLDQVGINQVWCRPAQGS